jgi:hypothetical protein
VKKGELTKKHIRVVRYFPHRKLLVTTLSLSGLIAGSLGFCRSPWQFVALRGLTGMVHFSGFIRGISLGEIVDKDSRNEGMNSKISRMKTDFSVLVACRWELDWFYTGSNHRRLPC